MYDNGTMLSILKGSEGVKDVNGNKRQWVLHYDNNDKICGFRQLYTAHRYTGSRTILNDTQLIKKLENEKE